MAGAIEEVQQASPSVVKDLFSGAVGGIAQVLIGMNQFTFFLPSLGCVHELPLCLSTRERSAVFSCNLFVCSNKSHMTLNCFVTFRLIPIVNSKITKHVQLDIYLG